MLGKKYISLIILIVLLVILVGVVSYKYGATAGKQEVTDKLRGSGYLPEVSKQILAASGRVASIGPDYFYADIDLPTDPISGIGGSVNRKVYVSDSTKFSERKMNKNVGKDGLFVPFSDKDFSFSALKPGLMVLVSSVEDIANVENIHANSVTVVPTNF
jgi:hypothetical protein